MIIQLTQGKVAIVDDEDAELLGRYKWYASKDRRTFYALTKVRTSEGCRTSLSMHRLIMSPVSVGVQVDHIDGNGLNNRRDNLRLCSNMENHRNRKLSSVSVTGFKGVSWSSRDEKYIASIRVEGKLEHLGSFDSKDEAHAAYCSAATLYYGKFANFG